MRKLIKDARAESGLGNGMLWLISAALLSVLIVSAGLMIDRQTALSERVRIEHAILDRLLHVQAEIQSHLDRDINLALSLADDFGDDDMLSPSEVNRTIGRLMADNPHISSIHLAPLADPSRMAFTPVINRQQRSFIIDIPVPPLPWQSSANWVSLVIETDGD
ncbi:MAG: diguanylate cyclase, partial [Allorhizobium sp.]